MKTNHSRSMLMACTAIALLTSASTTAAQNTAGEQTVPLAPIEVKSKKNAAAPASDTPLASQTDAEEVRKREIDSIDDLGNTTEPGISYSKRTDTAVIRGLSGPRIATVIDGIPIPFLENFARGGGGPTGATTNADGGGSSFDFSSLSAVDVLRGADSSRVGSGALGGALVLRTLEPDELIREGRNWGGITKITYDSEDNSITGAFGVAARFDATSALLQASYKKGQETRTNGDNDSYGRERTKANPADIDQNNLLFKLRHDIEGGHRIGITAERFERKNDTDLTTSWNVPNSLTSPTRYYYPEGRYSGHDDTRRERVSLDYRFEAPEAGGYIENAFATAYWQRLVKNAGAEGTQVRIVTGDEIPYMRDNELHESGYGFVGGIGGSYSTGTFEHDWRFGLDLYGFESGHYVDAIPVTAENADIPDVDGTRVGAFFENRIAFGASGFALTPGIRFDWHEYRPQESEEFANNPGFPIFGLPDKHSDSRFSPKLLATYEVAPDVELFAQWSAAYRAPTVNELYLDFTNPVPGYAVIGNPDLKSETGQGIELGANFGTEDFGGRATVFHNRYRNFIDSTDLAPNPNYPNLPFGVGSFVNIDRVEISGFELSAHKLFDNGIRLHGAVAYARGKNLDTDERLQSVAPLKAIAGIGYERETWGVDLTGIFVASMANTAFDVPGYGIANLTGWWEPEQVKGMRLQAGVYNLFDQTYYDALAVRDVSPGTGSFQPKEFYSEPGRTFKVSLTQRF